MAWFRLHESTLDSPKVQRLPDRLFKGWINMLCVASRYDGKLPPIADIAFAMRKSEEEVKKLLAALEAAKLIDRSGDELLPHDWSEHQYKSDVSTNRVREFRKRKKGGSVQRDETVSRNAPDTEQSRSQASIRLGSATADVSRPVAPRASAPDGARAGTPPAEPWEQRLSRYEGVSSYWSPMWGPRPGEPGCLVPDEFLPSHLKRRAA